MAGADSRFLKRGFKCRKGGLVCLISHKFLEIPHEHEIIWVQRGFESATEWQFIILCFVESDNVFSRYFTKLMFKCR